MRNKYFVAFCKTSSGYRYFADDVNSTSDRGALSKFVARLLQGNQTVDYAGRIYKKEDIALLVWKLYSTGDWLSSCETTIINTIKKQPEKKKPDLQQLTLFQI